MNSQCDICGTPHRLGELTLRETLTITCCVWCHEDKSKVKAWLEGEMKKALEESPEYERQPDGTYRHVARPHSQ